MHEQARQPGASRGSGPERIVGSGQMAERTRSHLWAATPLGPISAWPDALVILVNTILANQHPSILFWGDQLIQFFNDAAVPIIGPDKLSTALGQRADQCWAEVWPAIGPQIASAYRGQPVWKEDQLVPTFREGRLQDTWFTYSYSPVRDAAGRICGVLVTCLETTSRVRTEQQLLRERAQLIGVFERAPVFFAVLQGPDHVFERINPRYSRLIGGVPVIGKPVREALPTAVAQGYLHILDRVFTTGEPYIATSARYTPPPDDGNPPQERILDFVYQPLHEGGSAVTGILVVGVDVTDRKRVESQLFEQQERFAFATRAAHIGYWFCDLPFDMLAWDDTVKEHFWLPPHVDVSIDDFYAIIHPDDRTRTRQAIEHSIANHMLYDVEYRTLAPDGRCRWIRAIGRTAYDPDGVPKRFDGVTQDVTELKQVRDALDAERARLQAVIENVPIGILFTSTDGRIIVGNREAERLLGRRAASPDLQTYRDIALLHEDGRSVQLHERPLSRALAHDGGIYRGEFQYIRPDGAQVWLELIAAPIRDAKGEIIGAVDALADIDVRKRAEQALLRSEKLALVGRLAASISHEINNPLEAVINFLFLIESNSLDEVARNYSRRAQDELARVSHIVTHTLRFNRQTLGSGPQKLSALLDSSVAIYTGRLKNSGITLLREYQDAIKVHCSGSEIRQVFANLIANSFDATRQGGKLILRSRDQRHPRTGVPGVRVSIADTGHGMPPAVRRRLFEPFFTTKADAGTGLGLWVSREILNKHDARVCVKSRVAGPNSGTVFSIWFSAAAPPAE